jgi:phage shock protein C
MNAAGRVWTRSSSGILAGVCKGIAQRLELDVLVVRFALIVSILCLGTGALAYIVLALSIPREDRLDKSFEPRILGVCAYFSKRFDFEPGLARAGALTALIFSAGTVFVVYLILWFIMPSREEWSQLKSDKKFHV